MNRSKLMPTLIAEFCEVFEQSLTSFVENDDIFNENHSATTIVELFISALDESSSEACRSGLVNLIESFECEEESMERDGKQYQLKNQASKKFLSRFGEIEVNRKSFYHWAGGSGIIPIDEELELAGRYVMPDVVEIILLGLSMAKPSELECLFGKTNHFKPSASLIQDIANQDGQALNDFLHGDDSPPNIREIKPPETPVAAVVASFDGANLLVREPGKKRGARVKKPSKDGVCNGPIEKSCSYKNAMVGAISFYDVAEVIDIETGEAILKPDRISSSYVGRMPEERYPKFKKEFEQALKQSEEVVPNDVVKILLMDGARGFWAYADENRLYDDYIRLVDFYHATEHLARLTEALFGKSSKEGQEWYEKWVSKMKHKADGVASMLRSVNRYIKDLKLSEVRLKDVKTEVTFFKNNQGKMDYATLVEQGLPIGSGPVEAACKTIVKARFCQSGMRWSIKGGQNIMNLRVIQKSDQWDDTWAKFREAGGYHTYKQKAA